MVKALENHGSDHAKLVDEILSSFSECVIIIDEALRFRYVNHAGEKILGCSEEVVTDKTWRQLNIKPDIMEHAENNLRWVFLSGEVARDSISVDDGDKERFYEYTMIPLRDRTGLHKLALMAIRELTEINNSRPSSYEDKASSINSKDYVKRNIKSEIDDISKTMYGILEYSNTQVAYLNKSFDILMANNEFIKGLGHNHRQIIGRNYFDLFPRSKHEKIFKEVLMSGKPVKKPEEIFTYKSASSHCAACWDWIITPVKNSKEGDDETDGLIISILDVTQAVRLKILNDVVANISASLRTTYNVDKIIRLTTIKAAKALSCDYACALQKKNNKWFKKCLYGRDGFSSETIKYETGVFESSMALKENGSSLDIMIPLLLRDESIGRLDFISCPGNVGSYQMLADFASKLAGTITLALENSQLYEAKQKIADTLQEALLTMPDRLAAVDFCHLYHSASEVARVGGDFYDLFEIGRNKVGIIMGDVSGKGLEAAALTAVVKNTIKAYAMEEYNPALVMKKTNDVIRSTTDSSSFVTVLFTVLDVDTGKIVYCNAGHSAAIIKRNSGVDLLEANSPIIGAFNDIEYKDNEDKINKGDLMILYTDGVIEARSSDEFYGEERLVSFISQMSVESVKELPNILFQEVMRHSEGVLSDDLALLALTLKQAF